MDEYSKRNTAQRSQTRGSTNQLQLNIDRLFAERVSIFSAPPVEGKAFEMTIGTSVKAALKTALETVRNRSFLNSTQLATDLTFFLKCAGAFLPASGSGSGSVSQTRQDMDWLLDQLTIALSARSAMRTTKSTTPNSEDNQTTLIQETMTKVAKLTIVV